MLLLLFTQRLSTSNYYFSATTLCKSCLFENWPSDKQNLGPACFFSFSFLPFALLLVYEILGISLCHLAKQKPKTIYLNFPFLVDRQLRTFFLHTDTIKNYEFRKK